MLTPIFSTIDTMQQKLSMKFGSCRVRSTLKIAGGSLGGGGHLGGG